MDLWESTGGPIYALYRSQRRGEEIEKRKENLCKETIAKNLPNQGKERHSDPGSPKSTKRDESKDIQLRNTNKLSKIKDKENLKNCKRKATYYVQGNTREKTSRLFSRPEGSIIIYSKC